jgi:hypothetical protein
MILRPVEPFGLLPSLDNGGPDAGSRGVTPEYSPFGRAVRVSVPSPGIGDCLVPLSVPRLMFDLYGVTPSRRRSRPNP